MKKFLMTIIMMTYCFGAYAATQQDKMKTCNADATAKAMKGDERKTFMKDCLSAKPAAAPSQQNKMKMCNADPKAKTLKGDERKAFMKTCLSAK
ncbi:MAG: PsiF family protein [Methylotenera sp.]